MAAKPKRALGYYWVLTVEQSVSSEQFEPFIAEYVESPCDAPFVLGEYCWMSEGDSLSNDSMVVLSKRLIAPKTNRVK